MKINLHVFPIAGVRNNFGSTESGRPITKMRSENRDGQEGMRIERLVFTCLTRVPNTWQENNKL